MMMPSLWNRYRVLIHTFHHVCDLSHDPSLPHTLYIYMLQVNESLVDTFNTVAGIVPILKTHITEVGTQHTETHMCTHKNHHYIVYTEIVKQALASIATINQLVAPCSL